MKSNTGTPTRQPRYDGWTPARQRAFLDLLLDGVDVRRAAAQLGMSRRSVYHLRKRDRAFADRWDAALIEARGESGRRLIAELVAVAPWAQAAFPQGFGEGPGFPSQDSVTA